MNDTPATGLVVGWLLPSSGWTSSVAGVPGVIENAALATVAAPAVAVKVSV